MAKWTLRRARIAQAAEADTALAARIDTERALRDTLRAHFAPVTEAPVPPAWVERIRGATAASAQVIDLGAAWDRKAIPARRGVLSGPWTGAAIAASLVLGVFVGVQWHGGAGDSGRPIVVRDGVLVAGGDLSRVLDSQMAATQADAPIRILGTFRRASGDICRVFAGAQAAGIACHDARQWQLQHVLPGSPADRDTYRQAASHDAALIALAQDKATGAPLDAGQERAARLQGWRGAIEVRIVHTSECPHLPGVTVVPARARRSRQACPGTMAGP